MGVDGGSVGVDGSVVDMVPVKMCMCVVVLLAINILLTYVSIQTTQSTRKIQ